MADILGSGMAFFIQEMDTTFVSIYQLSFEFD